MAKKVGKAHIIMPQEISILDNGWKIKNMAMEYFNIKMGQCTMVSGQMTNQQIKDK